LCARRAQRLQIRDIEFGPEQRDLLVLASAWIGARQEIEPGLAIAARDGSVASVSASRENLRTICRAEGRSATAGIIDDIEMRLDRPSARFHGFSSGTRW
jgi:hypothetical protein